MFDAPRATPLAESADGYIQPTFAHALRIWWAIFWRTTLVSGLLTFGIDFYARKSYENMGITAASYLLIARYTPYVLNYAVAVGAVYFVLHKAFRHFRIVLSKNWGTPDAQILEPTLLRSIRIWWTYTWRTLVYTLLGYVVVLLPLSWFVMLFNPGATAATLLFGFVGFLNGGAAVLFAIHSNILDEDFGNFHVAIVPRTVGVPGGEIAHPAGTPLKSDASI